MKGQIQRLIPENQVLELIKKALQNYNSINTFGNGFISLSEIEKWYQKNK